jgi:hypothetical protein
METAYAGKILTDDFLRTLVNNWLDTCGKPLWTGLKGNPDLCPKLEAIEGLFPSLKDSQRRLGFLTQIARKSPFFLLLILFPENELNAISLNLNPLLEVLGYLKE